MASGDPGQEQFRNAIMECRNHDIAVGLEPLMLLRSEIVHSEDFFVHPGIHNRVPKREYREGVSLAHESSLLSIV